MKLAAIGAILLVSLQVLAAPTNQQIPYYGEKLYRDLSTGLANDNLKHSLFAILHHPHMRTHGADEIDPNCRGRECYAHISLGYDRARVLMMGVFSLIKMDDGSYAIHDVYCDENKEEKDFAAGRGPAPQTIPDGSVLNTEHTWPQSRFTGSFDKGMQKSDLHHLFPTDNELNSIRGNNPFGEVSQDSKTLKCKASRTGRASDGRGEVFEPPRNHRGNVARALFYFSVRYNQNIDPKQEAILRKWHLDDPVDEEEIRRNDFVHKYQGNRNPFVDYPELVSLIENF